MKTWQIFPANIEAMMTGASKAEIQWKRIDPEEFDLIPQQERKVTLVYEDGSRESGKITIPNYGTWFNLVSTIQAQRR